MTDNNEQESKRPLSLARPAGARLELKRPADSAAGQVRQSFSHGRSKTVQVEVKKKRVVEPVVAGKPAPAQPPSAAPQPPRALSLGASGLTALRQPDPAAPVVRPIGGAALRPTPSPLAPIADEPVPATPAVTLIPAAEPPDVPATQPEPAAPIEAVPSAPTSPATPVSADPEPAIAAQPEPVAEIVAAATPDVATPPPGPVRTGPIQTAPPPPRPAAGTAATGRPGSGQQSRPGGGRPVNPPSTRGTLVRGSSTTRVLTDEERAARVKALQGSLRGGEIDRRQVEMETLRRGREEMERLRHEEEAQRKADEESRRRREEDSKRKTDDEVKRKAEEDARKAQKTEEDSRREVAVRAGRNAAAKVEALTSTGRLRPAATPEFENDDAPKRGAPGKGPAAANKARVPAPPKVAGDQRRRTGKLTVSKALSDDEGERMRSLASVRRARERERLRMMQPQEQNKVVRDVVIPETITVQELAQRMAERSTDVIKTLMRMGVMATLNQAIDADTAELVVSEFGHNFKRVAEADVEIGLKGETDIDDHREPRPPVVTIMGHVDHGKTSLLDALRSTNVVSGEAGGITQHIGAYQVAMANGRKITFIDTPGHQAFTAMRARGANVTDIVVLVVAADDGIKDQTIEAIRHAKAANAPVIVAINKMDKPGANPTRVREELLQHEIVVEEMGGDVLTVEVSALQKTNLDKLEEAILLQAELLDLRSNPNRSAEGVIIEAKLERGRGPVATVLVQRGTLSGGDIFVAGGEWGRVRALLDDQGKPVKSAGPGTPVEVLGLNGAPLAGDDFSVVESESRAREVTEFRQRRKRDAANVAGARGTLEEMFAQIASGTAKELPVVVKSDVQGSLEAILASVRGLGTAEVAVRVLHSGVGGISESDITLARASGALVIGFNVRANPQARDLAKRDNVDIRYYSIIYDVIDDVKTLLQGMLAPTLRETFLGNAEIRQVFEITKTGKVGGCYVTEGIVRRGSKVRLLRDSVVIHEGTLKTLRRFKDDVKEVREGYECGMAFENYADIQAGDIIECFDIEEVARTL